MIPLSWTVSFLRSRVLTAWLVGLFVLYYLTMAVWSSEVFATYVALLSSNILVQALYVLFVVNVALRFVDTVRDGRWRRPTVMLRLPLFAGSFLLLCSVFLSLNVRQAKWSDPLGEGDVIALPWERMRYQIVSVEPALKKRSLRTGNDAIFDYEPGMKLRAEDGTTHAVGAFPPGKVGSTFFHVLSFGIGPGVEVRSGSELVWKGNVALRLVPFGNVDTLVLPELPYLFNISIVPNRFVQKGRETAREYDLEHPRYLVEVVQGDRIVGKGETEDVLSFEEGRSITFLQPGDWILIEAVHDPFLPWFAGSLALLVLGAFLFPASFFVRSSHR